MDAKFVNPFISAATNALKVMAGLTVERGNPFIRDDFQSLADVSGIIGFAGDVKGAVVLSFPFALAHTVYERMTGDKADPNSSEQLADAVGELANMVAGGAKVPLADLGLNIQISIPSIVSGEKHTIMHRNSGPCLVVPFELEGQTFWVQINMSKD